MRLFTLSQWGDWEGDQRWERCVPLTKAIELHQLPFEFSHSQTIKPYFAVDRIRNFKNGYDLVRIGGMVGFART
jgi:hypothetical protein